jgi:hypothetical protein
MAFSRPISPRLRIAIKAQRVGTSGFATFDSMEDLRENLVYVGSMEADQFGLPTISIWIPA